MALLFKLICQFEDVVLLWVWVSFVLVWVKVVLLLPGWVFVMGFSPYRADAFQVFDFVSDQLNMIFFSVDDFIQLKYLFANILLLLPLFNVFNVRVILANALVNGCDLLLQLLVDLCVVKYDGGFGFGVDTGTDEAGNFGNATGAREVD